MMDSRSGKADCFTPVPESRPAMKLLASSLLTLAATAAIGQPPEGAGAPAPRLQVERPSLAPASQAQAEAPADDDAERDARWRRLQADRAADEARRREAQDSYERGVREAAEARARYEADLARHNQEVERARAADADYQRARADYEAQTGGGTEARAARPAARDNRRSDRDVRSAASENERCQRRARGRGRLLGAIAGGVAGGIVGRGDRNPAAAIATSLAVGLVLSEAITRLLDCREQEQAAAATETAVAQAAQAGAERGVGTTVPWTSETRPGVTGSSVVTALDQDADGAQCMTVTDIVIVDGEETRAPKRMCRRPPSQRFVRV